MRQLLLHLPAAGEAFGNSVGMRVVLFGAGASYGSGTVNPRVPPLGGSLFGALRRLYATWRSVPTDLAELFEQDFEAGMSEVIAKHGFAIAPLMQEMAIFFSMFGIPKDGHNRYTKLLDEVCNERSDVLWSTLNYECLLESAGAILGMKIGYFVDVGADAETLPVWKLHGSCNFKVKGLEAGRGVSFGTGVVFGGEIEPLDPAAVPGHYKGNTALYPAMALYAQGKSIAMSPAPIQVSQHRWRDAVLAADRVLLLGVSPNPADDHIWTPLAETAAAIGYVGAEEPFRTWRDAHRKGGDAVFLALTWKEAEQESADFING